MTLRYHEIPSEMRALQVVAPGEARVVVCPVPQPAPDEVLLRVEGVSTCPHWDIHILDGVPMFADRPLTYPYVLGEPGHEAVGRVVAVGSDVASTSVGQRVATWRDPGGRRQGCYAQFVPISAQHVLPVPEDLPAESIAALELAMCVQVSIDQLNEISAIAGKRVAVAGLGPAGLIAIQLMIGSGASEVTAIEPDPNRHELGRALGAESVLVPAELQEAGRFSPSAFHSALDSTGLKVSIEALMSRTLRAVAIFGVLREDVLFGPEQWWGGFSLLGYGEHNRGAAAGALKAILSGTLDLTLLVSARSGLGSYGSVVDNLRSRRAIKVLIDPWMD